MTHNFIKDQIMSKDISRITEVIQKSGHEQVPSALVTTIIPSVNVVYGK